MKSNNELNSILDKVTTEIRNETVESSVINQAGERVWARLAAEGGSALQTAALPAERIESCRDFQSLIPAFLNAFLVAGR